MVFGLLRTCPFNRYNLYVFAFVLVQTRLVGVYCVLVTLHCYNDTIMSYLVYYMCTCGWDRKFCFAYIVLHNTLHACLEELHVCLRF